MTGDNDVTVTRTASWTISAGDSGWVEITAEPGGIRLAQNGTTIFLPQKMASAAIEAQQEAFTALPDEPEAPAPKKRKPPTDVQGRILELIGEEPRTAEELCRLVERKPNQIDGTLSALKDKGRIAFDGSRWCIAAPLGMVPLAGAAE